ncbi:MAG TPA: hypothetical protein DCX07_02865 [Phycisphaerales bacterium]|nr:hypothetical protein [Phycisphaerales bacterium]
MRIRCDQCRKKISVDDAFAGGVCRCPYCKAINMVGGDAMATTTRARPEAPGGRPEAPGAAAPEEATAPQAAPAPAPEREVPMARPVFVQGVVTMVLLGLLILMLAAGAYLAILLLGARDKGEGIPPIAPAPVSQPANPFQAASPGTVAGNVPVAAPVIYLIDGGSSMKSGFDYAAHFTRTSILSLKAEQKFNVLVSLEEGDVALSDEFQDGGEEGAKKAKDFLYKVQDSGAGIGASDIPRAMDAALAKKPGTIVLFLRKVLNDPPALAAKLQAAKVRIVILSLDSDSQAIGSAEALVKGAGGVSRTYTFSQLQDWLRMAPR